VLFKQEAVPFLRFMFTIALTVLSLDCMREAQFLKQMLKSGSNMS
jgi:hypothetical protein